jgi:fatty acid desaturase
MPDEDEEETLEEELPERATPLLAVVRIVCVLGMAFGVSFGLFMALGFWWIPSLLSFASAVPFFFLMRFMEKRALEGRG